MTAEIITLPIEEWEAYRALRLRALKEEPQAFAASYAEQVQYPPEQWQMRLRNAGTTGREWLLDAETRSIDDQIEWLDATHVLYGVPRSGSGVTDVWVAPIDGGGPARVFIPAAESPAVVH